MYQREHPNDGYNALRLYLEKLNPECSAFFQYPKRSWKRPQEGVNENSLRTYNTRPSSQLLQLCSNMLSTALNS
ncbi:unnamed protein product, partial [Porites evermanni]